MDILLRDSMTMLGLSNTDNLIALSVLVIACVSLIYLFKKLI